MEVGSWAAHLRRHLQAWRPGRCASEKPRSPRSTTFYQSGAQSKGTPSPRALRTLCPDQGSGGPGVRAAQHLGGAAACSARATDARGTDDPAAAAVVRVGLFAHADAIAESLTATATIPTAARDSRGALAAARAAVVGIRHLVDALAVRAELFPARAAVRVLAGQARRADVIARATVGRIARLVHADAVAQRLLGVDAQACRAPRPLLAGGDRGSVGTAQARAAATAAVRVVARQIRADANAVVVAEHECAVALNAARAPIALGGAAGNAWTNVAAVAAVVRVARRQGAEARVVAQGVSVSAREAALATIANSDRVGVGGGRTYARVRKRIRALTAIVGVDRRVDARPAAVEDGAPAAV